MASPASRTTEEATCEAPPCPRCERTIDGSTFVCADCHARYCDGCSPEWGQCDQCWQGYPLKVGATPQEWAEWNRANRNEEYRHAIFQAVFDVLTREEEEWATALLPEKAQQIRELFEWSWGRRSEGPR